MQEKAKYRVLKYCSPLIVLLGPALVLYGFVNPWEAAEPELSKYKGDVVLLIGIGRTSNHQNKSYLVIDDNIRSKTIDIYKSENGSVRVEEKKGGLMLVVVFQLVFVAIACWLWFFPHNKALQSSASGGA